MPVFGASLRRLAAAAAAAGDGPAAAAATSRRRLAREALAKHTSSPSARLPVIPTCPAPTCPCSEEAPADVGGDIDHTTPLYGTMAAYQRHLVVASGQADWPSRVEDAAPAPWGRLVAELKAVVGRGGDLHNPYMNMPINVCSFEPSSAAACSALLFPAFEELVLNDADQQQARRLAEYAVGNDDDQQQQQQQHIRRRPIRQPTILVCSHGGRDKRCGTLGPILLREFARQLHGTAGQGRAFSPDKTVNVGGVSHVGGHKWAGNVILYIPPGYEIDDGTAAAATTTSPLAGTGIWYGRVEPRHVQGIIEQTLRRGTVIQDLFRGGIDQQGHPLRL